MFERFNKYNAFKLAVLVIVVVFMYLFALNGRYEYMTSEAVLDKWKKEVIRAGSKELPVIYNGDNIKP